MYQLTWGVYFGYRNIPNHLKVSCWSIDICHIITHILNINILKISLTIHNSQCYWAYFKLLQCVFNLTKTQCQSQPLEYKCKDFMGNIRSLDSFNQRPSFDWTSALTLNLDRFDHDLTSVLKLDRLVWFQNSWVGMARSWLRWCLGDSTSLKRGRKKVTANVTK